MVYVRKINASAYRALPKHNELLQFFDGSFLEASKAVPFHATATMVWTSLMPPFLFWPGPELLVSPQFQVTVSPGQKIEKRTSELSCHEESTEDEDFLAQT